MKSLLVVGGSLGFGIGMLFSWTQRSPWPSCLWHACLAMYLTGILIRWWGGAWRKNLESALRERQSMPDPSETSTLSKSNKS